MWSNPSTTIQADEIIHDAKMKLFILQDDDLDDACKQLAIFAGSFNHVWDAYRRNQLIILLVSVGFTAIDPVLEALVDLPRAEQFDITNLFIRQLVEEKSKV